jgi:hypothetical protein
MFIKKSKGILKDMVAINLVERGKNGKDITRI